MLTPSTGYLNIGLSGTGLTDASGNTLLGFLSGGAGSYSHLQVSNSNTGMPALSAVGTSSVSLDLTDTGGAGVKLYSNGVPALTAANAASTNTAYITVNGAATGSPATIGVSDSGATDSSLQLQPQGAGTVIVTGNVDTKSKALFAEFGVNATGASVTAYNLVILDGTGGMEGVDTPSGTPLYGVIGIALNTAIAGSVANVAYSGVAICKFDSAVTFNHYVVAGAGGLCHDNGTAASTTAPTGKQPAGCGPA